MTASAAKGAGSGWGAALAGSNDAPATDRAEHRQPRDQPRPFGATTFCAAPAAALVARGRQAVSVGSGRGRAGVAEAFTAASSVAEAFTAASSIAEAFTAASSIRSRFAAAGCWTRCACRSRAVRGRPWWSHEAGERIDERALPIDRDFVRFVALLVV